MKANETIGTLDYDALIIDGRHDLDVKHISATFTQDEAVARGTILDEDGAVFDNTDGDKVPDCIVADEFVGTGESQTILAYKSGNFNKGALIVAEGYDLADADVEALRTKGIFIESAM